MKPQVFWISRFSYCLLFCLHQVQALEIPKSGDATTALNLPGAWGGGVVPGGLDVGLWNSVSALPNTAGNIPPLGGDLSVAGIKVTNVGGSVNVANSMIGSRNASSANTLTIGALGIDMTAATQAYAVQSKVTIAANQTWNIANANTVAAPIGLNNNEDLGFVAQAAGPAFNFGNNTVTTSGMGQITIGQGYTLSNGTLEVGNNLFVIQGGSQRTTSLTSDMKLRVSSGTLRIQSNSGPAAPAAAVSLNSAAVITANGGLLEFFANNSGFALNQTGPITLNTGSIVAFNFPQNGPITVSGPIAVAGNTTWRVTNTLLTSNFNTVSGALSGTGNIAYQNTATGATAFTRLSGNNNLYSGTITLNAATGNRILRLFSNDAGSAAATWDIGTGNTLQFDGVSAQLGTLQGLGTVTNSSTTATATANIGAGNFPGLITNGASQLTNVTKVGAGTLVLSGANTYTGTTTAASGTLITTPDQIGTGPAETGPINGPVVVNTGATFGISLDTADTTFKTSSLTLGSPAGGTLQLDFGNLTNPSSAPLFTTNLVLNTDAVTRVIGKNLTTGTFPLIQYTTLSGAAVTDINDNLALPARTTGSLNDTGTEITLTIASEQVKWNGNNGDDWDVDPDGLGVSGTPNWRTTVGNVVTRYLQGTGGTDVVHFDDSATGLGHVNLTTTLTPLGITVNNTGKDYSFGGSGHLSGVTGLEKSGTGSLTIANTTANDYIGGTVIHAGTLKLGDGTTAGAGAIAGSIANEEGALLVINRPDDHSFTNSISGAGAVEKTQAGTATATGVSTIDGPVTIAAGKLKFTAGSTLGGIVSGPGLLEAAGGNVTLEGSDPNTISTPVTVSAGALRLGKSFEVDAVGGDINITGSGTVALLGGENIPDTATVTLTGTSADCFMGSNAVMETFAHAVITGPVALPETQMILRSSQTISGTATVNQGILGVASAHTATVNGVVMTSPTAILRISGNSAGSTMNVGPGGITASGGNVQVKFNANEQQAILNLSGDVTTTGDLTFTNGGYGGVLPNIVNLEGGARTFNIGVGTTTTVAPDIGGTGSLVKAGAGTLTLNASCAATPAGGTTINDGLLLVNGSVAGSVQVNASGTLGGSGSLSGATVVDGTVAPGAASAVGTLNSSDSVTLGPDSDYAFQISNWANAVPGTDWDHLIANSLALTATPANPLVIHVTGTLVGPEAPKTMVIATSTLPITGFTAGAITVDNSGFSGSGSFVVQVTGNTTLELVYTAGTGTAYNEWADDQLPTGDDREEDANPDGDGDLNYVEFATDGEALSGANTGKVVGKVATLGGQKVLILTLPVRGTALTTLFTGTTEQNAAVDGIQYRIEGGNDLNGWALPVSEVTGAEIDAIHDAMPDLNTGWTYRTFRTPGTVADDAKEFIRVLIAPAA